MNVKTEKEIRELKGQDLVDYTHEFMEEYGITNPMLQALAKRIATSPTLERQLIAALIGEHNRGKVWTRDDNSQSSEELDDDLQDRGAGDLVSDLEDALESIAFDKLDLKIMNQAAFDSLLESVTNTVLALTEQKPEIVKNVVKELIKAKIIGSTSLNNFDKLLDSFEVGQDEFRPQLHRLAAMYRGKEKGSVFSKGLFRLTSSSEKKKDLDQFEKDANKVVDEAVRVTREVLKTHGIRSSKDKRTTVDDSWRRVDQKSALVESLENMLTAGYFELHITGGPVYLSVSSEEPGSGPALQSLREIVGKLTDFYNAEDCFRHSRDSTRDMNRQKYRQALVNFMKYSVETDDPLQQAVCFHFLSPSLLPHILEFYEDAYDKNDKEFLDLLQRVSDRYSNLQNPDSPFFDKSKFDIPSLMFSIETGSPLHFCIEGTHPELKAAARRIAKAGKYLDIKSTSKRFPESRNKLPSEFAKIIGLDELATTLAAKEKKFNKSKKPSATVSVSTSTTDKMLKTLGEKDASTQQEVVK